MIWFNHVWHYGALASSLQTSQLIMVTNNLLAATMSPVRRWSHVKPQWSIVHHPNPIYLCRTSLNHCTLSPFFMVHLLQVEGLANRRHSCGHESAMIEGYIRHIEGYEAKCEIVTRLHDWLLYQWNLYSVISAKRRQ